MTRSCLNCKAIPDFRLPRERTGIQEMKQAIPWFWRRRGEEVAAAAKTRFSITRRQKSREEEHLRIAMNSWKGTRDHRLCTSDGTEWCLCSLDWRAERFITKLKGETAEQRESIPNEKGEEKIRKESQLSHSIFLTRSLLSVGRLQDMGWKASLRGAVHGHMPLTRKRMRGKGNQLQNDEVVPDRKGSLQPKGGLITPVYPPSSH